MRTILLLILAIFLGGTYYLQTNPEVNAKLQQTFSRENLLEPKFSTPEAQEKYKKQLSPLFYSNEKQEQTSHLSGK